MKTILNDFLHLFFPNICLLCKEPLVRNEKHICLNCICILPHTHYYREKENPVYQLFIGKADIQEASSFFYFEKGNSIQKLIHALKYYGNKDLGYTLGRMAVREWNPEGLFQDIDLMIPVPLHTKRERNRGYNQAEYIARGIQSIHEIPIEKNVLTRAYSSTAQVHKNFFDRWLNTKDLFSIKNAHLIQHKHILLVDDVVTSGSTLSACANILLSIEGVKVSIFTLATAR